MARFTLQKIPTERFRPAIELAAFLTLAMVDLWLLASQPLASALARAAMALIAVASWWRHRSPSVDPSAPAGRTWGEVLTATVALAVFFAVWVASVREPYDEPDFDFLDLPPSLLGVWVLRRLGLAAVQQVVLQLFLWPTAREVLGGAAAATIATAAIFGLLHLPSPAFALGTALTAVVWLRLYRRGRRLTPLIVSHALLITMAHAAPERMFYGRAVGARAMEHAASYRLLAREDSRALLRAVTSDRYFAHRGGSECGYLEGLYRDLLGRPATADELATWLERLKEGSRASAAKQMLAADELDPGALRGRWIDDEALKPGVRILPDSPAAEFEGWYDAEPGWRWAREAVPAIRFQLEPESDRLYVLALACGAAGEQQVDLELDGNAIGGASFFGLASRTRRFLLGDWCESQPQARARDFSSDQGAEPQAYWSISRILQRRAGGKDPVSARSEFHTRLLGPGRLAGTDHELRLHVKGERAAIGDDTRLLGLGFRALELTALRFPSASVAFPDDSYFLEGFSVAEERLRWTDGSTARMVYPLRRVEAGVSYELRLTAGAFERQRVEILLGGESLADWTFEGLYPTTRAVRFDAVLLRAGANILEFRLPDAASPEGDPRRLGLALVNLRIYPQPP